MVSIAELRKPKVAGMAVFDISVTAIVGFLFGYAISPRNLVRLYPGGGGSRLQYSVQSMILAFVLGVCVHFWIGQPTQLNGYLGLNAKVR